MLRIKAWPILLILFVACHAQAAPTDEQLLATADNTFSFNLLQQLAAEQPGSNIFISAYSASTALQMISLGAAGNTLSEMEQALSDTNLSRTALDIGDKSLNSIINAHNTNFILSTANAIWFQDGLPLEHPFVAANRAFFRATVQGLNFNAPSSAQIINRWASQQTHGKINQVVQYPFPPGTCLVLNNAVYFFGNWLSPFDTNATTDQPFFLSDGGQETVPMMTQNGEFGYSATADYQAIRLPYAGNKLAMYVFLPSATSSLPALLDSMNGQSWRQLATGFWLEQGTVSLPRFKLSFSASFVPALMSLGMETAFTPEADFSKLSPQPIYISDVLQQAVVDVSEKGTEAAAVTTIIGITAVSGPSFAINVNRPFLFFIVDEPAGAILFSGAVYQP